MKSRLTTIIALVPVFAAGAIIQAAFAWGACLPGEGEASAVRAAQSEGPCVYQLVGSTCMSSSYCPGKQGCSSGTCNNVCNGSANVSQCQATTSGGECEFGVDTVDCGEFVTGAACKNINGGAGGENGCACQGGMATDNLCMGEVDKTAPCSE